MWSETSAVVAIFDQADEKLHEGRETDRLLMDERFECCQKQMPIGERLSVERVGHILDVVNGYTTRRYNFVDLWSPSIAGGGERKSLVQDLTISQGCARIAAGYIRRG